jgi:hypothetical protein
MVKKNTSIELAVALMLKGMAYVVLVCAMFLLYCQPYRSDICKELIGWTVSSIVYRFHSIMDLYPFFYVMSALKNKQNKSAQRISNSIKYVGNL